MSSWSGSNATASITGWSVDCAYQGAEKPPSLIAVLPNEQAVHDVICDSELLKQLAPHDIVVTAQSSQYDFLSRYFWPANGGYEDPVTGSIHAALAPYWAQQLNKRELTAYQASQRGGVLHCKMIEDDRIIISGSAVLYLRGKVYL